MPHGSDPLAAHLVKAEHQVQLAHVAEILIQNLRQSAKQALNMLSVCTSQHYVPGAVPPVACFVCRPQKQPWPTVCCAQLDTCCLCCHVGSCSGVRAPAAPPRLAHLYKQVNALQVQQLVVSDIYAKDEVQPRVAPVDELVRLELQWQEDNNLSWGAQNVAFTSSPKHKQGEAPGGLALLAQPPTSKKLVNLESLFAMSR
jgi:hypothetical protein